MLSGLNPALLNIVFPPNDIPRFRGISFRNKESLALLKTDDPNHYPLSRSTNPPAPLRRSNTFGTVSFRVNLLVLWREAELT